MRDQRAIYYTNGADAEMNGSYLLIWIISWNFRAHSQRKLYNVKWRYHLFGSLITLPPIIEAQVASTAWYIVMKRKWRWAAPTDGGQQCRRQCFKKREAVVSWRSRLHAVSAKSRTACCDRHKILRENDYVEIKYRPHSNKITAAPLRRRKEIDNEIHALSQERLASKAAPMS